MAELNIVVNIENFWYNPSPQWEEEDYDEGFDPETETEEWEDCLDSSGGFPSGRDWAQEAVTDHLRKQIFGGGQASASPVGQLFQAVFGSGVPGDFEIYLVNPRNEDIHYGGSISRPLVEFPKIDRQTVDLLHL
jgi:hypothetical protein